MAMVLRPWMSVCACLVLAVVRLDVRVGDVVHVGKAGDIVPEIVGVDRGRRPAESVPWVFPEACPSCQSPVGAAEGRTRVRFPNEACAARVRRHLEHFVSVGRWTLRDWGPRRSMRS